MRNVEQNNRKIKILFPEQESYFSIELKGSEQSLKELLGAILKISPSSIKGLKDNYNNYYTLSSALKSKNINTTPHTFFSIITTGETNKINISQQGINPYNINLNNYMNDNIHNNNYYFKRNQYINNNDIYYNNIKINNIKNYGIFKAKIEPYSNFVRHYSANAYYNLINFLYNKKYIGKQNYLKLKKCIDVNNNDVMNILKPFIEFDKDYSKLINNLFPILNLDLSINGNSYLTENVINKKENNDKIFLLNNLKDYFSTENMEKLKYLLLIENISILNIFESYEKNYNFQNLIDELYALIKKINKVDLNKSNHIMKKILKERRSKSFNYKNIIKKNNTNESNIHTIKNNKKEKKYDTELIEKISNKIINYGKNFSKDIFYLMKYELKNIDIKNKYDLFTSTFKIDLKEKNIFINKDFSEKVKKNIKKYYKKYITTNIYNFLDEEENDIYSKIMEIPNSQEYNDIIKFYSELISEDNKMKNKIELLRNKIINYLKEIKLLIEENNEEEEEQENESNNDKDSVTSRENNGNGSNILKLEGDYDEDEEEDEIKEDKKEDEKDSSDGSSSEKNEENEDENYDNVDDESGVSIKKGTKNKKK